jgi:hypothetical protein
MAIINELKSGYSKKEDQLFSEVTRNNKIGLQN